MTARTSGWPRTAGQALAVQDELRSRVDRATLRVPVFVSVGHRIGLDEAVALTLRLAPSYRLPESTRVADRACRDALRRATVGGQIRTRQSASGRSATLGPSTAHRGKGAGVV